MLKWHKVGCYATAFAAVELVAGREGADDGVDDGDDNDGDKQAIQERGLTVSTVQQRRDRKAQGTHWLVTGAKDGKVSLWDIY